MQQDGNFGMKKQNSNALKNTSPTKIPKRDLSLDSYSSDEESQTVVLEKAEIQLINLLKLKDPEDLNLKNAFLDRYEEKVYRHFLTCERA